MVFKESLKLNTRMYYSNKVSLILDMKMSFIKFSSVICPINQLNASEYVSLLKWSNNYSSF